VVKVIDEEKLKADFKQFCIDHGLESPSLNVKLFNTDDCYFTDHDYVWDEISYNDGDNPSYYQNQEELEVDREGWFKSDFPSMPDDFPISQELYDLLVDNGYIQDDNNHLWVDEDGDLLEGLEDKTYVDLPDEMKVDIDDFWTNGLEIDDLEDNDFLTEALEIDDLDERYNDSALIEAMAYWCTYFEPRREDYEAAWESGLIPFKYKGTFMLALGGCGMDLSPKLDCYQALVSGSVRSGSQLFRQVDYFDYVSPVKSDVILKKIRKSQPEIVFYAYEKPPEKPEASTDNGVNEASAA
jgi:hypothetical protein